MLVCTTWKSRPLSPEQANRMMAIWGKLEAEAATETSTERVCWYIFADGSGGMQVDRVKDAAAGVALSLETSLALGEFLELDSRIVLDIESALPAIAKAMERANG